VINGLGHFWGYRNFSTEDASTNISPLGHPDRRRGTAQQSSHLPTSAKLSIRWYEFDIGWLYIRILAALGLAQVKKVAPRPRLGTLRPVVDFDTLQAVITNRYDVLSRYAQSLKQVYREELGKLQDGSRFKGLKRWLAADAGDVPQELRGGSNCCSARAVRCKRLRHAPGTGGRLGALECFPRAPAPGLQDWCERAENSGVRQLQELSMRLRSYVLA
jgi:stearoyl-CoA desaturase (delta-9 desaturase)